MPCVSQTEQGAPGMLFRCKCRKNLRSLDRKLYQKEFIKGGVYELGIICADRAADNRIFIRIQGCEMHA